MSVSAIISRIDAQCPGFVTVTHAMTSAAGMAYPAAVVALTRVDTEPPALIGIHQQLCRVRFGVYIVDARSQAAGADALDGLRAELRAALVGWQPAGPYLEPLFYAGGQIGQYQDGLSFWREEFGTTQEIRI